jgi:hypothetical protein
MPGKAVPIYDRFGAYSLMFRHTVAHGYTRHPIFLGSAFAFVWALDFVVDDQFKAWNKGNTQADMWDKIERLTKEKAEAAEE